MELNQLPSTNLEDYDLVGANLCDKVKLIHLIFY